MAEIWVGSKDGIDHFLTVRAPEYAGKSGRVENVGWVDGREWASRHDGTARLKVMRLCFLLGFRGGVNVNELRSWCLHTLGVCPTHYSSVGVHEALDNGRGYL